MLFRSAAVADLSPLLAFSVLLNSVQPVLSGKLQHFTVTFRYGVQGRPHNTSSMLRQIRLFDLCISLVPLSPGVAVGEGWQSVVAYVNITSYYLIGIPLGVVLGYVVGIHVKVMRCIDD